MTAPTLELTEPDTLTNGHRTRLAGAAASLSDVTWRRPTLPPDSISIRHPYGHAPTPRSATS